jgi:hypothetical protein
MSPNNDAPAHGAVVDIGGSNMYDDVAERLEQTLMASYSSTSKPTLPDELLYDDVGLPIWNQIIFTPEFYQTHDEIALFDKHGADVAARCQAGVTIVDPVKTNAPSLVTPVRLATFLLLSTRPTSPPSTLHWTSLDRHWTTTSSIWWDSIRASSLR